MNRLAISFTSVILSMPLALLISSCSQQPAVPPQASSPTPSAPATSQAPPASQPAQPASTAAPAQPVSPANVSVAKSSDPLATEKHALNLTDYSKVGVTVTLNGGWVGQWDSSVNVPLDTVLQGKNAGRPPAGPGSVRGNGADPPRSGAAAARQTTRPKRPGRGTSRHRA